MRAIRALRQTEVAQSVLFDQDCVVSQVISYAVCVDVGGSWVGSVPDQDDFVAEGGDVKRTLEPLNSTERPLVTIMDALEEFLANYSVWSATEQTSS